MTLSAAAFRTRTIVCFAIIYLVWGSSYLATALGVHRMPPFLFGGVRFVIAGIALVVISQMRDERILPTRIEWWQISVMALLSICVSNGFNVWALQWVPSNQAALLNVTSSFWIPIFGLYGARAHAISTRAMFGLALGFLGTLAIVWPRDGVTVSHLWPQIGILIGCMGWAAGTIFYRNAEKSFDVLPFTGWQMILGGIALTALGLAQDEASQWTWSIIGLGSMFYLIVFSSCLAYTAYAWLSHHVAPARVATYGFVNPAIATVLGWWILDERLTNIELAGMAVILSAVALVNWPDTDPAPESPG